MLMNTRGAASGSEKISSNELAYTPSHVELTSASAAVVKHSPDSNVTARDEKEMRAARDAVQKKKKKKTEKKRRRRRRSSVRGRKGREDRTGGGDTQSSRSVTIYAALRNRGFTKAAEIGDKRDNS